MNFFAANVSDSDEEHQEYEVVENDKGEINPFWYTFTDDDDEEEKVSLLSGVEKWLKKIEESCDTFTFHAGCGDWHFAASSFTTLLSQVRSFTLRDRLKKTPAPSCFLECIISEDFSGQLADKVKSDFQNAKDFQGLKRLIAAVSEAKVEYEQDIQAMVEGEDEEDARAAAANEQMDEGESSNGSEQEYAEAIKEAGLSTRKTAAALTKIAKECGRKSFIPHQISALAMAAKAHLNEDNLSTSVKFSTWQIAFHQAHQCLQLLEGNRNVDLTEDLGKISNKNAAIVGGLPSLVEILYAKLLQIGQSVPGWKKDYLQVPIFENSVVVLADSILHYYDQRGGSRKATVHCCKVLLHILGHRRQEAHEFLYRKDASDGYYLVEESIMGTVKKLYKILAPNCDDDTRMMAVCYIAYQYGLEAKHREGKEVLLRMGVQDYLVGDVKPASPSLSILFNRAIAQLGLAAFIAGDLQEAYQLSGGAYSLPQLRAQIGQGLPPRISKEKPEEELKYRDLCVCPHHYISQEHLQMAAMLTALVIDTTKEAQSPHEKSRLQKFFFRAISARSQFFAKLTAIEHQIGEAYIALKNGNYGDAKAAVEAMTAWETLPNGKVVLAQYLEDLKDAAVRVFCLTNGSNFATFSVPLLAAKYETDEGRIRSILNEIISDSTSLTAYWDRDDTFLFVDRSNPTQLQHLVLSAADNVSALAPYTERRMRGNDGRGRGGRGRGGRGRGGRGGN